MIKEIDGISIHYLMYGSGTEKVLLLHGWGCDSSFLKPVADALQENYQVLIPDFPGHGKSGFPPMPWGVPEYAECLLSLLKETGFTPCHVIAHSFGCRIAAWLAAETPSLFEKLIFTGAAGIRPKPTEVMRKRSARYKKLRNISESFKRIPILIPAAEKFEEKLRLKYGSKDYNALDEEMRKTFVKVINQDLSDLYERFHSSTLLIWGDADTETPLWMAKEMERRIPDAGLVILKGGTHFAYLEQLPTFNMIAMHFLKGDE